MVTTAPTQTTLSAGIYRRPTNAGCTALHLAMQHNAASTARFIMHSAAPLARGLHVRNPEGRTPLHQAVAANGFDYHVDWLLNNSGRHSLDVQDSVQTLICATS